MKKKKAKQLIEDRIRIWNGYAHLKILSEILANDKKLLISKLVKIDDNNDSLDQARQIIAEYAIKKVHPTIDVRHFVFQGHSETTEIVFEDAKGTRDNDEIKIVFDHIIGVMLLIIECLSINTDKTEFIEFTKFFLDDPVNAASKDHAMRYKTALWFAYMLLEIIKFDPMACQKGEAYLEEKLWEIIDALQNDQLIKLDGNENDFYDKGIWAKSLFVYLQGDDRKSLMDKLVHQFNKENHKKHVNRCLLIKHHDCLFKRAIHYFCNGG